MRIETIGNATLYLGDCREILPTISPANSALVTDPPYGLGELWNGGGSKGKSKWKFDPKEAKQWDGNVVDGVEQIASYFGEAIVWGGNYYRLAPSRRWLIWDKKQNDQWTTGQAEMAWTNIDKPVRVFRFAQCEQASEGAKLHPTQKPIALMEWCLKWITAQTVFDPFMGSGTTGVACARMGKTFTGIEREPKYFDIACHRIEDAYRQGTLFEPNEPAKAEQMGMF